MDKANQPSYAFQVSFIVLEKPGSASSPTQASRSSFGGAS